MRCFVLHAEGIDSSAMIFGEVEDVIKLINEADEEYTNDDYDVFPIYISEYDISDGVNTGFSNDGVGYTFEQTADRIKSWDINTKEDIKKLT